MSNYEELGYDGYMERTIFDGNDALPVDMGASGQVSEVLSASTMTPSQISAAIPAGGLTPSTVISTRNPGENMFSSNFVTGVSGYAIYGIGDVEFNNGTFRGALTAATIDIGGSDATSFHVDINGNMWLGAATFATATFSVSNAGSMIATDGQIATWYINATTLSSGAVEATSNVLIDSANSLIRLGPTSGPYVTIDGANQRIRSSNYSAGAAGFTVGPDLIEAGNFRARGSMKMANFEKNTISSIGGAIQLNKGSDTLAVDMTALDSSTLEIRGTETFAVGDFLEIKEGTDDEWFEVTSIAAAPIYTVTRDKAGTYSANNNPAWKKGATVVNYGASGQGFVAMQAAITNSPWIKIATHSGSPWSSTDTKVLIGQLKDKTGIDEYGIWIKSGAAYIAGYRLYEAVVDAGGNGDYLTLAAAIAAGKTRIFMRNGTYTMTASINLPDGCTIIGESMNGVILDANNGSYVINCGHQTPAWYGTGTVSVTFDSATVTGAGGTAWLTNAVAGQFIRINDRLYKIKTVNSDTQITLEEEYYGATLSGLTYAIASYNQNIFISNISVTKHVAASGFFILDYNRIAILDSIKCFGFVTTPSNNCIISIMRSEHVVVKNCNIQDGYQAIRFNATNNGEYAWNCIIENNEITSRNYGITSSQYDKFLTFSSNYIINTNAGIIVSCTGFKVCNNVIVNNSTGIQALNNLNPNNLYSVISGNIISGFSAASRSSGSGLYVSVRNVSISNNSVSFHSYGIQILTNSVPIASRLLSVSNNVFFSNTNDGINCDDSDNISFVGNQISENAVKGINIIDSTKCVISSNVIYNNTSDGIYLSNGDYNTISGNDISNNGAWGVNIPAGSDNNIVLSSIIQNNTTGAVNNLGAGNDVNHNI